MRQTRSKEQEQQPTHTHTHRKSKSTLPTNRRAKVSKTIALIYTILNVVFYQTNNASTINYNYAMLDIAIKSLYIEKSNLHSN